MHRFMPTDRGYEMKDSQMQSQPAELRKDLGTDSNPQSSLSSYPASPEMTESWKDSEISHTTFRHPFQLAAAYNYSAVVTSPTSATSSETPSKPMSSPSINPNSGRSQGPNRSQQPQNRPRSFVLRRSHTPVSFSTRHDGESFLRSTVIPLSFFVPVPPLLSLLYLITGHGILRSSSDNTSAVNMAPLIDSVKVGVTGGAILSLPLTIVIYLLLFPTQTPSDSNEEPPLDFFDDDDSHHNGVSSFLSYLSSFFHSKWRDTLGFIGVMIIMVFVGTIAGPLGATCLSTSLNASLAAKAGTIGGLVLSPVIVGASVVSVVFWRMQKLGEMENSAQSDAIRASAPTTNSAGPNIPTTGSALR
ncbi:hypothetical protein VNI00_006122 [Paramarasmius palmivorus]|uniref:Uncharacterized protein n=1 Tax=Paramarasmius palmivorus TaxID=297713 RepID=A0AAW0D9X1_9AGAR